MSDPAETSEARFQRIWEVVARIPAGRVMAYGQVARVAGLPGRARMVSRALKAAPDELDLPWHRVLGAGGRIALPAGSSGAREQAKRLRAEGVAVSKGRVPADAFSGGDEDLDALIWGP